MEEKIKIPYLIETSSSAYFVGSLAENKTLYLNQTAKEVYGMTAEDCDFTKIFDRNQVHMAEIIQESLKEEGSCLVYDLLVTKKDGNQALVDFQLGYFDQEKTMVYLELIPQANSIEKLTVQQVIHSPRAEAILNLDENLSIFTCNPYFYRLFGAVKPDDLKFYEENLGGSLIEDRQKICQEILAAMTSADSFYKEMEITTVTGVKKWISLDLYKRVFQDQKEKVLCYATNIDEKIQRTEELSLLNQYLSVVQASTVDLLYRVDIATNTMYHYSDFISVGGKDKVICDYVEVFMEKNTVHPEDKAQYLEGFRAFYEEDKVCDVPVRFSLGGGEYQWYKITAKKIFDQDGKLKEVFGALVNVEQEQAIREEMSTLNQFFTAMQEMDQDVVFRIELSTMTLHYKKQISPNQWQKKEIPDFFNTFQQQDQVHPDDRERYFRLAGGYFNGSIADSDFQCEVRFALVTENYVWYDIKCRKIYDKQGNATEVYGKLLNIETEKVMSAGYSKLNQYFTAMQSLTQDVLFHIDVKTKTFTHSEKKALDMGIPLEIPNFVTVFLENGMIREEDREIYLEYTEKLLSGEQMDFQIQVAITTEEFAWFHIKSQFIYDEKGEPSEIFGTMENIQHQKDLENKANYDGLTETRNISSFVAEVKQELRNPETSHHHALVFIDMDDFKSVNDSYGHQFGDFVLETFAKRLKNCVRDTDIVGRLGGDEFVVYLKGVFNEKMALDRANTILERLKPAIGNGVHAHVQGASMGIALIPNEGITYEELYANADKAVYHAKKQGKNIATVYHPDLEAQRP